MPGAGAIPVALFVLIMLVGVADAGAKMNCVVLCLKASYDAC